jgi:hypothetical protein
MTYTSPKLLTLEAFIEQYGDKPRYELIDGELRDMDQTNKNAHSKFNRWEVRSPLFKRYPQLLSDRARRNTPNDVTSCAEPEKHAFFNG